MEGIERLEKQLKEMDEDNVTAIFEYLKTRTDLYELYKNEEKNMQGMYDYICSKAKKKMKNNVAMIADNVVYLWAVTYFTKSNEELGIKEKKNAKTTQAKKEPKTAKVKEVKEPAKNTDSQISMFEGVQK